MTTSPLPPDPYHALGLSKECTIDQVRSSYRKLVLKAHPDRFPQATSEEKQKKTDEFHKIQQAYELLTDDTRRLRYDERAKLAELKAELMKEHAASQKRQPRPAHGHDYFGSPRTHSTPFQEPRRHTGFEERDSRPSPKFADDEFTRFDPGPVYDDPYRHSPRSSRQDDSYKNASRRASAKNAFDEVREERASDEKVYFEKKRHQQEKESEMKAHAERKKQRDKSKRHDTESKRMNNSPKVEEWEPESEDDYDAYARRGSEPSIRKSRDGGYRRSHREERSTRRSREINFSDDERASHDDYSSQIDSRVDLAADYILQNRKRNSDSERPRNPARQSSSRLDPPPPAPPAPAASTNLKKEVDLSAKRSSASRKAATRDSPPRERSSRREKSAAEAFEGSPKLSRRSAQDSSRGGRPRLNKAESAPSNIEIPELHGMQKAATWNLKSDRDREREREKDPKPVRRTHTTPQEPRMRQPHGSSNLRRSETVRDIDDDYSSPDTPDGQSYARDTPYERGQTTRYSYKVSEEPDDNSHNPGTRRVVTITPDAPRTSSRRDVSPRARDRAPSREVSPHRGYSSRRPTMPQRASGSNSFRRSNTLPAEMGAAAASPSSSPRLPTGFASMSSGQGSSPREGLLFNEIPTGRPSAARNGSSMQNISIDDFVFQPRFRQEDVSYSSTRPDLKNAREPLRERERRSATRDRSYERDSRSIQKETYGTPKRHASQLGRQSSYKSPVQV